jgi:hypothetical protein
LCHWARVGYGVVLLFLMYREVCVPHSWSSLVYFAINHTLVGDDDGDRKKVLYTALAVDRTMSGTKTRTIT